MPPVPTLGGTCPRQGGCGLSEWGGRVRAGVSGRRPGVQLGPPCVGSSHSCRTQKGQGFFCFRFSGFVQFSCPFFTPVLSVRTFFSTTPHVSVALTFPTPGLPGVAEERGQHVCLARVLCHPPPPRGRWPTFAQSCTISVRYLRAPSPSCPEFTACLAFRFSSLLSACDAGAQVPDQTPPPACSCAHRPGPRGASGPNVGVRPSILLRLPSRQDQWRFSTPFSHVCPDWPLSPLRIACVRLCKGFQEALTVCIPNDGVVCPGSFLSSSPRWRPLIPPTPLS